MKNILAFLTVIALAISAESQTLPNTTFYLTNCGYAAADGTYTNDASGSSYAHHVGDAAWYVDWDLSYTVWALYNYNTNSSPLYQSTTSALYGSWISSGSAPLPAPGFSPIPLPPTAISSVTLNNFWPLNGGRVSFQTTGWNNSSAASNSVIVQLGGTAIFTSPWTAGRGRRFTLSGSLDFDGTTNLISNISFTSGDTNLPGYFSASILTNFNQTNVSFSIGTDPTGDTNLVLTSGSIQSQFGQAFASLVPLPMVTLPQITIPSNTASSFGLGAGQMCSDSNYAYFTRGTNLWGRVAITNW
jgi:hypothetical protein